MKKIVFNIRSKPNQSLTKEAEEPLWEDEEEIDIYDHFDTDKSDDFIAGYFRKADYDKGVYSIIGELTENETEELLKKNSYVSGGVPTIHDVELRLKTLLEEWDGIEWEVFELLDENGTNYFS